MPEPSSQTNTDVPYIFWFGILTDDISVGIMREKSGYQIVFNLPEGEPQIFQTKVAPWIKKGISREIAAFLQKQYPILTKYTKDYLPSRINDLMGVIKEAIQKNPQAAALIAPENGSQILDRIVSVTIYPSDDGAGGGCVSYELEVSEISDFSSTRMISLTLDDMTSDSSTAFRRKWTSKFPTEFLDLNREDWINLRTSLISQAIVKDLDQTGEIDSIIESLCSHIRTYSFVTDKETWGKKPHRNLLYEKGDDISSILVAGPIIQDFLKRNDLSTGVWLPKMSRECQKRGITLG